VITRFLNAWTTLDHICTIFPENRKWSLCAQCLSSKLASIVCIAYTSFDCTCLSLLPWLQTWVSYCSLYTAVQCHGLVIMYPVNWMRLLVCFLLHWVDSLIVAHFPFLNPLMSCTWFQLWDKVFHKFWNHNSLLLCTHIHTYKSQYIIINMLINNIVD